MNEHERRLEGLRYRLDKIRSQIPHDEYARIWGRIEGRQDSIALRGSEYPDEMMEKRVDDIESELEDLEEAVSVQQ